jgi:hypothetical protein
MDDDFRIEDTLGFVSVIRARQLGLRLVWKLNDCRRRLGASAVATVI